MTSGTGEAPRLDCPDLRRASVLDFGKGLYLAFQGVGLVFARRKLRTLTLAIAALTVLILLGLSIGLWYLVPSAMRAVWPDASSWITVGLRGLLGVVLYVALFVVGANLLPLTLAAPLIDPISVEIERMLGQKAAASGIVRTVREIHVAFSNAVVRLGIMSAGWLGLSLLFLVPAIKPIVWLVGLLWSAFWIGVTHLDVPMARHLHGIRAELRLAWRRLPLVLGFGSGVGAMLAVPLLNAFFVPVAAAAATLLFQGLVAAGEVKGEG